MHVSKLFYFCFIKIKSSRTWLIPASLYEGPFFTFNTESVFLFLLSPPKQTSSIDLGYHSSYCIVKLNINLYIDFTIGSWSFSLKHTSSLFWFSNTFVMELLPLRINQVCGSHCFHVKRIYNFWLIHACFVMLSHISIIILHHFYAFCWTNLLTRCLVPVSYFLRF